MTSKDIDDYVMGFVACPEAFEKLATQLIALGMIFTRLPQIASRRGRPRKFEGVVHRIGRKERRAKG